MTIHSLKDRKISKKKRLKSKRCSLNLQRQAEISAKCPKSSSNGYAQNLDDTATNEKRATDTEVVDASIEHVASHDGSEEHLESRLNMLAKQPRTLNLMPIKTRKGLVHRKVLLSDKSECERADTCDVSDAAAASTAEPHGDTAAPAVQLTAAQLLADRQRKLNSAKLQIGLSCRQLLEAPQEKIELLRVVLAHLNSCEANAAATIRKYAALSLLEVFRDLLPEFPLAEHSLSGPRYKKDVLQLYRYENTLLNGYKRYLVTLENNCRQLKNAASSMQGVCLVSLRCLCDCLVAFSYFNFAPNLVDAVVPYVSHPRADARQLASSAICAVFAEDKKAERSLQIVRRISHLIKSKQFDCRSEIIDLFLHLPIRDVNLDKDKERELKEKKFLTHKEKLLKMSRRERKRSKKLEAVEREMLATKAEENKQTRAKYHTQIITVVFEVYFRVLKNTPRSKLMSSVLTGLAKFAHMINVDFFLNMLDIFDRLLRSAADLATNTQALLCVHTVFAVLSGQGESLSLEPQRFYTHCYRALDNIDPLDPERELRVALQAIDAMLVRRRRKTSPQQVLAFSKRLASLALHWPHSAATAALAMIRTLALTHSCVLRQLEVDEMGGGCGSGGVAGVYRPDVNDPEHCGAVNTHLYELACLTRSYHSVVRELSAHVIAMGQSQNHTSSTLSPHLRNMRPVCVLDMYSTSDVQFVPSVTAACQLKFPSYRAKSRSTAPQWLLDQTASPMDLDQVDFASTLMAFHTDYY